VLEVDQVSKHYGGLAAVADVSLRVDKGEIRCLVGPNGAGKTTLFNILAGSTKPSSGRIRLLGHDVTGLSPRHMSRLGVARKYQSPSVFDEFTVRDNILIALDGKRPIRQLLRHDHRTDDHIETLATELGLADQLRIEAGHLSHGQRQWLEIGMMLANDPQLLLLDEPTAGMTRDETASTEVLLRRVARTRQLTTIVIEHDIGFVRALGDRITVLHKGRVLVEGSAEQIEGDPEVRRVFLGGS
jgi:urea ABC transporter ATP-binding protein UrtD